MPSPRILQIMGSLIFVWVLYTFTYYAIHPVMIGGVMMPLVGTSTQVKDAHQVTAHQLLQSDIPIVNSAETQVIGPTEPTGTAPQEESAEGETDKQQSVSPANDPMIPFLTIRQLDHLDALRRRINHFFQERTRFQNMPITEELGSDETFGLIDQLRKEIAFLRAKGLETKTAWERSLRRNEELEREGMTENTVIEFTQLVFAYVDTSAVHDPMAREVIMQTKANFAEGLKRPDLVEKASKLGRRRLFWIRSQMVGPPGGRKERKGSKSWV